MLAKVRFVADLHIHSHYSRATSRDCNPENLQQWAVCKGISLLGTGDFTHPGWREELRAKLEPAEEGLYRLRPEFQRPKEEQPPNSRPVRFVVTGEISSIYKKDGRVRKVHHLLILPNLEAADELSRRLELIGNIRSDGRPILGLDSRLLLEMMLEACPEALYIPAHIWTPHFSVFGANSGFDSLEECYGDLTKYIYAVETGLSSDPPMNWRLSALDRFTLVSNSDAHSPSNLGREANLLDIEFSYPALRQAIVDRNADQFIGTLEFFPEEGKYHWDGHRDCQVRWAPAQTRAAAGICPICKRRVTVGVLHRVEELADRPEGFRPPNARPFESLVPLPEILSTVLGVGVKSKKVRLQYQEMLSRLGPELSILREIPIEEIATDSGELVAESIRRMRAGKVQAQPGFDGEYGKIWFLPSKTRKHLLKQTFLFEEAELESDIDINESETAISGPALPRLAASQQSSDPIDAVIRRTKPAGTPVHATKADPVADTAKPAFTADLNPIELPESGDIKRSFKQPQIIDAPNLEQQAAITASQGPVVVIAGPGTGKTQTLVRRIAHLIQTQGVSADQITAVTFTNKAAKEIRSRLAEQLAKSPGAANRQTIDAEAGIADLPITDRQTDSGRIVREPAFPEQISGKRSRRMANRPIAADQTLDGPTARINLGTFHSICLDLLRAFWGPERPLLLLDEVDARRVFAEVIREQDRKQSRNSDRLFRELSFCKNQGFRPDSPGVSPKLAPLYKAYQERLAEYRAFDYDDLLLNTAEIFETSPASEAKALLLKQLRQRFTGLLVDEFQDVNPIQYRLVRAWAGTGENTFVIGDPDQAIYGFRGADYRFFGRLQADFPKTRIYQLRLNYRSAPAILEAAAAVISPAPEPDTAPPCPAKAALIAVRSRQSQIQHWVVPSALAEGISICQEINRLVGGINMLQSHGQGAGLKQAAPGSGAAAADADAARSFSEIAVLYRTSRQAAVLEECLLREGIPYRILGRESFLDNPQVRTLLNFLWVLQDPTDDFHLFSCLNNPVFGLNKKLVNLIRETSRHSGCTAWDALLGLSENSAGQRVPGLKKLPAFAAMIEKYRVQINSRFPQQLLMDWIEENSIGAEGPGEPAVKRLLGIASGYANLDAFLRHLVLATDTDHERMGCSAAGFSEFVTLMTMHAAKGLEFPVVFIAGAEDGLIPLKPLKIRQPAAADLAEERRLFYVGITRAKDELLLLSARHRVLPGLTDEALSQPSIFLQQIPEALLSVRILEKQKAKSKAEDTNSFQQLSLF